MVSWQLSSNTILPRVSFYCLYDHVTTLISNLRRMHIYMKYCSNMYNFYATMHMIICKFCLYESLVYTLGMRAKLRGEQRDLKTVRFIYLFDIYQVSLNMWGSVSVFGHTYVLLDFLLAFKTSWVQLAAAMWWVEWWDYLWFFDICIWGWSCKLVLIARLWWLDSVYVIIMLMWPGSTGWNILNDQAYNILFHSSHFVKEHYFPTWRATQLRWCVYAVTEGKRVGSLQGRITCWLNK